MPVMEREPFFFIIFFIIIHGVTVTASHGDCPPKVPALFVFGDSYADAGNNNYIKTSTLDQANFYPYGKTYFKNPTGRFSDGLLIPDFIGNYTGLNGLVPAFLDKKRKVDQKYIGVNLASGGAGALPETLRGFVIDLPTQLKNYQKEVKRLRSKLGENEAQNITSNAIYFVSIGTSDYVGPLVLNPTFMRSFSQQEYVNMVIGNLTQAINEIHTQGGRKIVVPNLGPLGCLPGLTVKPEAKGGCLKEASDLAKLHNHALKQSLRQFKTDLNYHLFDFEKVVTQMTTKPHTYGLNEVENACCGSGRFNGVFNCGGKRESLSAEYQLCSNSSNHLFWDSYHYTQAVYKTMASQCWEGIKKTIFKC